MNTQIAGTGHALICRWSRVRFGRAPDWSRAFRGGFADLLGMAGRTVGIGAFGPVGYRRGTAVMSVSRPNWSRAAASWR